MKPIFRHLLLGACLLSAIACTSLRKQADDQYQAGAFEAALALYDKALAEDPADADALAGRRRAREQWIGVRLLTVRKTRLGENAQGALDLLLKVFQDEESWKVFPGGAVASTQEEETGEALPYLRRLVLEALREKFPFRGEALLERYKLLFSGNGLGLYADLQKRVAADGRQSCERLGKSASAKTPYYAQLVAKLCGLWHADTTRLTADTRGKLQGLYGKIEVKLAAEGLPDGVQTLLVEAMENAFRSSPWFDPKGGQSWKLALRGRYDQKNTQVPQVRVHEYSVQVPYTAYEATTKWREVPYTDYEYQCQSDPSGRQVCANQPVTRYRSESYQENEPVTRYRAEPRTQTYDGIASSQTLTLGLDGKMDFGSFSRPVALSDKSETEGFEHHWNLPAIGLTPQSANLQEPLAWLRTEAQKLAGLVEREGEVAWEQYFCHPLAGAVTSARAANQVQRCLRRKPSPVPAFVESWYASTLGVGVEEAGRLIGLNDF